MIERRISMKKEITSFKKLCDKSADINPHGYWLAKMEVEIMLRVWKSRSLKEHHRHIGKIIDECYDKVWEESSREYK